METDKSTISQRKNDKRRDSSGINYEKYKLSFQEKGIVIGKTFILTSAVSLLFYDSLWAMISGIVIFPMMYRREVFLRTETRAFRLRKEFKEAMLLIASSIQVGYSVENAFVEAQKDMLQMTGKQGLIYKELNRINTQVKMNVPIEHAYMDFARRSALEEAERFGEIFLFAKRSGGNYGEIIRKTAIRIQQKIEVEEEIQTIMTEKQLEMKIMAVMPIGILTYIHFSSGEFIGSLYHNIFGILVMSICIAVYALAVYLGNKMIRIQV